MDLLSRGEILGVRKRRKMRVDIAGYGAVCLRSLTAYEMSRVEQLAVSHTTTEIKHLLVCATMEDETGELLFALDDAFGGCFDEVDSLFMNLIYRAASLFTGFTQENEHFDKVEEAVKNYKSVHSNGSPESAQPA